MTENKDEQFMQIALDAAKQAANEGEVPVGAVLVASDGETILAVERNAPIATHDPTAHAEIRALRTGAKNIANYRLTGSTLYVTLEPCAMCAGAISLARVGRLVYGAEDPKGGAIEHGPKFFDQSTCHHHPSVSSGLRAAEASELLVSFFRARR